MDKIATLVVFLQVLYDLYENLYGSLWQRL
ncbi:hypothetical protein HaLaN_28615, partial [Haematococcus lacustris]